MPRRRLLPGTLALGVAAVVAAGCSSDRPDAVGFRDVAHHTSDTHQPEDSGMPSTEAGAGTTTTSLPRPTTTVRRTTTTTTSTTTSTTTTTIDPLSVVHRFPIDLSATNASWTPEAHSTYRATDIFASSDCGTPILSVVDGVVDDVMPNTYDRATDDPALRGGNAVSVIGVDGVRYYFAHFDTVDPAIAPGAPVTAGQVLGLMGSTGRAGACHLHFGLSLPCPDQPEDWWIRRGVIWPDQYLAAWRDGQQLSPLPELQAWFAEYPDACQGVEGTPYAVG